MGVNFVYTLDRSGKLRIARTGNTITCYYWNGAWQSLGFATDATLAQDGIVDVGGAEYLTPNIGTASVIFSNLFYNSPVANFTAIPSSGPVPLTVQFTDTSTGTITGRVWDFGDGSSGTAQSISHIYNNPGNYTAKLTVTGPGGSDVKTATITGRGKDLSFFELLLLQ